ncbi:hypothetical protein K0M31_002290 [Melipona bicolor]|uniref:Uncharacterized protein n=1 Tax=Melipona bicolor TaxID=60889 RepID=A0AA40KYQ3_9HYME|nr:hypothetical protein K0M31_002290 [Melipona bicolor]
MEEILNLHNRHQESTSTENKKEKMDIEKNEKAEKNTQPWITIPPKKRKNKSKDNQSAEKPGTSKKPPTSTPISSHQPPKHLVINNKGKPQTQTLIQPQLQLDTLLNRNNDNNNQRKPPPIILYENKQKTQTISILEKKIKTST